MRSNWILERYFDFKFRTRKKQLEGLLSTFLGFPIKLERSFRKSSKDNIYNILFDGRVIAIARVRNEYRLKVLAGSPEKYNKMLTDQGKRFQREWEKCQKAYPYSLAPEPLFKDDGIIVFKFVEGTQALDKIREDFSKITFIVANILEALKSLYQLNILHGDLSLFNCIITHEGKCVFFDLESDIPDFDSHEKRIAHEYLHLIDASIKFLPEEYRKIEFWVDLYSKYLDARTKGVDITVFEKDFKRLNIIDPHFAKLKKVFE
jgi:tRNA A-37 threonylcarbamoyl transferase component Bud32